MEPTLQSINQKLDDFKIDNKEEHKAILFQTTKTNGTIADIQKWRYTVTGGLIVINSFILPILLWLIYKNLK